MNYNNNDISKLLMKKSPSKKKKRGGGVKGRGGNNKWRRRACTLAKNTHRLVFLTVIQSLLVYPFHPSYPHIRPRFSSSLVWFPRCVFVSALTSLTRLRGSDQRNAPGRVLPVGRRGQAPRDQLRHEGVTGAGWRVFCTILYCKCRAAYSTS